jgi:hypothetical protein
LSADASPQPATTSINTISSKENAAPAVLVPFVTASRPSDNTGKYGKTPVTLLGSVINDRVLEAQHYGKRLLMNFSENIRKILKSRIAVKSDCSKSLLKQQRRRKRKWQRGDGAMKTRKGRRYISLTFYSVS